MSFGLEQCTIIQIQSVFSKYTQVECVVLYGSRAKGDFRRGSDIDLVLIGQGVTEQVLSSIKIELDDLNTPYLFDVSIYSTLNSDDLKEHIDRVGKVFFNRSLL